MNKDKKLKIGLALGAGGARGLAHIGVLKVLEKEGLIPDYVAGSSMGSLIGAYYCLGFDLEELEKEVKTFSRARAVSRLMDLNNPRKSLIKGKKVERYIDNLLKGSTFKDLERPFRVVATDLGSGEEVILEKGSLTKSLMASISVPGIFPPVRRYNKNLVDGGVANFTPVDVVADMGADFIIGVDLIIRRRHQPRSPGMFSSLIQSYEIIRKKGSKVKVKDGTKDTVLIKPEIKGAIDSFRFSDINRFIMEGERAAKRNLPVMRRKLRELEGR